MGPTIDYYSYDSQPYRLQQAALSKRLIKLAKFFALIGLFSLFIFYGPSLYYWATGGFQDGVNANVLADTSKASKIVVSDKENYLPAFDASLPAENRISIPSIGVDSVINEAPYENYEEALKQGVWRTPDFNTPSNQSRPTILAAHRFGYLKWSNLYRRHNSFFNLPKLKEGDTIEIVWRQRKYVYTVYAESTGEAIEDYSADLILYTCNDLSSDVRIIKYAKLLRV